MSYSLIADFGNKAGAMPDTNPLSYCAVSDLDSAFSHTMGGSSGLMGPNTPQCQLFMAQYCAHNPNGWDGVCEYKSNDTTPFLPNSVAQCNGINGSCMGPGLGSATTQGQILIRNTASEKYLKYMSGNCIRDYQPFDPTVPNSPLISKWIQGSNSCGAGNCNANNTCIPIYDVDEKVIDNDPVMNKILAQPWIAMDILINIFNHRKRSGTLEKLRGTKLYKLYSNPGFAQLAKTNVILS